MKNQYEIDYQQGYDKANEEWLERLDKIRAEIKRQEKWLMDAGYNAYNVDIAFNSIKSVINKYKAESEVEDGQNTIKD